MKRARLAFAAAAILTLPAPELARAAGGVWTPVGPDVSVVESLAFDFYGGTYYLYAGTGAGGVWLTTDRGQSWQSAGLPMVTVHDILVLNGSPGAILVGTNDGVYSTQQPLSTASTWNPEGLQNIDVTDLVMLATGLMACTSNRAAPMGVYTTVGLPTWTQQMTGLPGGGARLVRSGVIRSGGGGYVLIATEGGVFESADAVSLAWAQRDAGLPFLYDARTVAAEGAAGSEVAYVGLTNSNGIYRCNWVVPTATPVWTSYNSGFSPIPGEINEVLPGGSVIFSCTSLGLAISASGSTPSWFLFTPGMPPGTKVVQRMGYIPAAATPTPGDIFIGTMGNGVFSIPDNLSGAWQERNTGLRAGAVFDLDVNPTPAAAHVYAALWGGVFRNTGGAWQRRNTGLAYGTFEYATMHSIAALPSSSDPNGVNTSLLSGSDYISLMFRSNDSAANWSQIGLTGTPVPIFMSSVRRIAHDFGTSGVAYFAALGDGFWAAGGVFRSVDGGTTWMDASNGLPAGNFLRRVTDMVIAPGTTGPTATLYCGMNNNAQANGWIWKSTNAGANWAITTAPPGLGDWTIRCIDAGPNSLWAGTQAASLYRSTDGGTTWTGYGGTLPAGAISAVRVNPSNPSQVWAAVEGVGMYQTMNGGSSWAAMNNGTLSNRFVQAIDFDPVGDRVLAGTIGSSIHAFQLASRTGTITRTFTFTPTATNSGTPTVTATPTATASATSTNTSTPTATREGPSRNLFDPSKGEVVEFYFSMNGQGGKVAIYSSTGTLVLGPTALTPAFGPASFRWDGRNKSGTIVASGLYYVFVKLDAGSTRVFRVGVLK